MPIGEVWRLFRRGVALPVLVLALLTGYATNLTATDPVTQSGRSSFEHRPPRTSVSVATGNRGVVASETLAASKIGCQILQQGGNAVDAAVAVGFALQVSWPEAGNIGGGSFLMISPVDGEVEMIDARERAPLSIRADSMAQLKDRNDIRFVGTPGSLRGMELAHQRHGRLPWPDLVRPSIELARNGLLVDAHLAHSLNSVLAAVPVRNDPRFDELRRVYEHPDTRPWRSGDWLVQPDLAATLQIIADQGADAFYHGSIANALLAEVADQDGWITEEDLRQYAAKRRKPRRFRFMGHELYLPELPSAAGIVIPMQIKMLKRIGLPKSTADDTSWTADQIHRISEVMRRSFRERAEHLGDLDYIAMPDNLTSNESITQMLQSYHPEMATDSESLAGDLRLTSGPYQSEQTTHFSVLDADAMGVSCTTTLEQSFGSRIVVRGAGFLLNNEMGDFNRRPGYTNRLGTIGTPANQIAAGKRMLSSMSPTIVKKDGQIRLLVGTPGGRTILNTVSLVLIQRLMMNRPLTAAVDQPRFHHQWFPDQIQFEAETASSIDHAIPELRRRGHSVNTTRRDRQGSVHAIEFNPQTRFATAVSDWRRGGSARAVRIVSEVEPKQP